MALEKTKLVIEISADTSGSQKAIKDIQSEFGNFTGEVKKSSQTATKEVQEIEKKFQKLAELIKKSGLDKNIKIIEQSEGQRIQASLKVINSEFNNLDKTITATDFSANKLNQNFNELNNTVSNIDKNVSSFTSTMAKLSGFFGSVVSAIFKVVDSFNSLLNIFNLLTDPQTLTRLANLASLLSGFFLIKGNFKLASFFADVDKKLISGAESAQKFGDIMASLDERAGTIRKINNALDMLGTSFKVLSASAAVFVGAGLFRTFNLLTPTVQKAGLSFNNLSSDLKRNATNFEVVSKSIKLGFGSIGEDVTKVGSVLKTGLGSGISAGARNFLSLAESGALLAPILLGVGKAAFDSESSLTKLFSIAAIGAGLILGGLNVAFTALLSIVGNIVISIGDSLLGLMTELNSKFAKTEQTVLAFKFTLLGFSKTLGVEAVGSLAKWNVFIEDLVENTTLSTTEIQKSISMLVKESVILGLTMEQNQQLLKTGANIAAATGKSLEEVTGGLINAMTGNSQAALGLGLDVRKTALEHSKYGKALDKNIEKLDSHEQAQLAFNAILEQTSPILGIAEAQTNTIAGSNAMLERSYNELAIRVGQQGQATVLLNVAMSKLYAIASALPDSVTDLIGTFIDLSGVILKVFGTFLKYILLIATVTTVFTLLSLAVTKSIAVQSALGFVLTAVASSIGVQAVAVTSLSSLFLNLSIIVKGGLIVAFKAMGTAIIGLSTTIYTFTASILANPLFWKAVLIVGAILIVIKAIKELIDDLSFLNKMFKSNAETTDTLTKKQGYLAKAFEGVKNVLNGLVTLMTEMTKGVMIGWLGMTLKMAEAWLKLQRYWSDNEGLKQIAKDLKDIESDFAELDQVADKTKDNLSAAFEATAHASDILGDSLETTAGKLSNLEKLAKQLKFSNVEVASRKIIEFGTEAEAANEKAFSSLAKYNMAVDKAAKNNDKTEETLKDLTQLRDDATAAFIEKEKLSNKIIKENSDAEKSGILGVMQLRGQEAEAAKIKGSDEMKAIQERYAELQKLQGGKLTEDQIKAQEKLMTINKQQLDLELKSIAANKGKKDADKAAKEIEEANKKIVDQYDEQLKKNQEINLELSKIGKTRLQQLHEEAVLEFKKIILLEKQLKLSGQLTPERQKGIEESKKIIGASVGAKEQAITGGANPAVINTLDAAKISIEQMAAPMMAPLNAASAVLSTAQGIVDAIPGLINQATGLLNSITNFPQILVGAISGLLDAIIGMVSNLIPNIILGVEQLLMNLVQFIADLPIVLANMLERVPEMLMALVDKLPEITEKLVVALITGAPRIAIAMLKFLVIGMPKLAFALLKVLVVELPKAIIEGIVEGLKEAFNLIKNFVSGGFTKGAKQIEQVLAKASKGLTGAASKLFKVGDLDDSKIKEVGNVQKGIAYAKKAIDDVTEDARKLLDHWGGILADLWHRIFGFFGQMIKDIETLFIDLWRGVYRFFTEVFGKLIGQAWHGILHFFTEVFGAFIGRAWHGIIEFFQNFPTLIVQSWRDTIEFIKNLPTLIGQAWHGIIDFFTNLPTLIGQAWHGVMNFFENFGGFISRAWQGVLGFFEQFGTTVANAFSGIGAIFTDAFSGIVNFFDTTFGTNVAGAFSGIKDFFENIFKGKIEGAFASIKNWPTDLKESLNGFKDIKIGGVFGDAITELKKELGKLGGSINLDMFGGAVTKLKELLGGINPSSLITKMFKVPAGSQGTVEKALGIDIPILSFSKGGMVPGIPKFVGDSEENDKVLTALSPGEAVIPRSLMKKSSVQKLVAALLNKNMVDVPGFGYGGYVGQVGGKVAGGVKSGASQVSQGISNIDFSKFDPSQVDYSKYSAAEVKAATKSAYDDAAKAGQGGINALIDMKNKLGDSVFGNIAPDLMQKVNDMIMQLFEQNGKRFKNGGSVGFTGTGFLEEGEFVISRPGVEAFGLQNLQAINRGDKSKGSGGGSVINQEFKTEIKIETSKNIDKDFIRYNLAPELEKIFREKSYAGKRLLSSGGIG